MGWIIAAAGLLLAGFMIQRSVDKETAKSLKFLLKILTAGIALLLLGAIVLIM